jgi:hypothetical protein
MPRSDKQFDKVPFLTGLGGLGAAQLIRAWMSTLDYRIAFYDHAVDPAHGVETPRIYIFWHEYILYPLYMRGHCHLSMLLSRHRDADVLARVAHHLGFDCVRGSTYRGSVQAMRELLEKSRHMHLAITPDGPRGPRRQLAQGPIYLASKLQLPLVVMGFGYDRPWRVNSWDRFAIPRPFSRARAIISPPVHLPHDLDRDGLEHCRGQVEALLNSLTAEAEAWATTTSRKAGEFVIYPQAAPRPRDESIVIERPMHLNRVA